MSADILSPKDGYIQGISIQDGATVALADTICNISDDEENISLERLTAAQGLMQLDSNLLSPAQIQLQQTLMQIAATVSAQYVTFAQAKLTFETQAVANGSAGASPLLVSQATAALEKAKGEGQKAGIALQSFNFNIQQAQAKQLITNSQITSEIAFMKAKRDRLTLKASIAGTVKIHVSVGAFVTKGFIVATIS